MLVACCLQITVSFKPDLAAAYSCMAYLDVSGRQGRQPLSISGNGIGPQASLSFDILDVGDIFLGAVQRYEIVIQNKGDIAAKWNMLPSNSRFSNNFQFLPREGVLDVGRSQTISVRFCSESLGEVPWRVAA